MCHWSRLPVCRSLPDQLLCAVLLMYFKWIVESTIPSAEFPLFIAHLIGAGRKYGTTWLLRKTVQIPDPSQPRAGDQQCSYHGSMDWICLETCSTTCNRYSSLQKLNNLVPISKMSNSCTIYQLSCPSLLYIYVYSLSLKSGTVRRYFTSSLFQLGRPGFAVSLPGVRTASRNLPFNRSYVNFNRTALSVNRIADPRNIPPRWTVLAISNIGYGYLNGWRRSVGVECHPSQFKVMKLCRGSRRTIRFVHSTTQPIPNRSMQVPRLEALLAKYQWSMEVRRKACQGTERFQERRES